MTLRELYVDTEAGKKCHEQAGKECSFVGGKMDYTGESGELDWSYGLATLNVKLRNSEI